MRRDVEQMISVGMTHADVARVLGVARNTVRKHFADELAMGAAVARAGVIGLLFNSARAGKVSAMCTLLGMMRRAAEAEGKHDGR